MRQLSDRLLFHALCLQPGGSGLLLSVLVPHELRRPSQKATVLRKVFNVQHSGSKESHLFENIKDHHGASCFFPLVPALPSFPFQLKKTDVNQMAIYLFLKTHSTALCWFIRWPIQT